MYHTIVVGGGPAGMIAAIKAAQSGKQVVLLERNEKLGKKLYITGKGRCNITNDTDVEHHLKQITTNKKFLYSALYSFDSSMLMTFFEEKGLKLKVERGQRVFPESDRSSDVIKVLSKALEEENVNVRLNTTVTSLIIEDNQILGVKTSEGQDILSNNVIVATGGISYDMTGSTGDGYKFAKSIGHKIVNPIQGLVPLETVEKDILELQGLALKNVKLQLFNTTTKSKVIYEETGEMLFTHFGISGPLVLSASSYLPREESLSSSFVTIDLKPGLSEEVLDKRIVRDFDKYSKKSIKNGMVDLLPTSMIPIVIQRANINPVTTIDQITKEQRQDLVQVLKGFKLNISGRRKFNEAIITRGGVSIIEIDPHTMESKKVKGLYFVGEVLDLDALTGGFNLQIAFSTGYLAGMSVNNI